MTVTQAVHKTKVSPEFVVTRPSGSPDTLLTSIGNTPLFPLDRIATEEGIPSNIRVFAKAEWFNASGSVKARPALAMIEDAMQRGVLTSQQTIIEATSGNTGIALAMIGTVKGLKVKLVMPANASQERIGMMKAYGAELVLTDPLEGIDGSIRVTDRMLQEEPDRYFRPNQYDNPVNWQAHYHGTGVEIWQQTEGAVTHFLAGLGTGGTFMGTSRRLKAFNPKIETIAIEPADELAIIEGLKHMKSSIIPEIYLPDYPDRHFAVWPEDAHQMARRLALQEGLFVGYSAGAAVWAAMEIAKSAAPHSVIVTVLPDGGEKYLSVVN